jgi:altronate dehydratase large subunit
MPVIKITGNINTWNKLNIHMDFNVSGMIDGVETVAEAGKRLFDEILKVASGKLTKAEVLRYDKAMNILTYGPVI